MSQFKKPPPSLLEESEEKRDFGKEIKQIGNLPGAPDAPLSAPPPEPKAPPPKKEDSLGTLLWRFVLHTRPGMLLTSAIVLLLIGKLFNPGIFGFRTIAVALLGIYLVREYRREVALAAGRDGKPDLLWIKIILVPTVVLAIFELGFLWKQHVASELTREISGNPNAWAECQRFTPALFADSLRAGYYAPSQDSDRAIIQYIYCQEWGKFYFSDKSAISDIQTLWSVGTVIHEAVHVSGEYNEAVTQCLTHKAYPQVLQRFGISKRKAEDYAAKYAEAARSMPRAYLNGECSKHPLLARVPQIFGSAPAK